jgi:hypothetical protein
MKAFLKVLVEGRASLYLYTGKRLSRFFYRLNGQPPGPLVSKQYLGPDGVVHANQQYIKVLADSLSCSATDFPDPSSVRYEANSLVRFFIAYNTCTKSAYSDYYAKTAKMVFHLNIRPGADLANFVVRNNSSYFPPRYSYGNSPGFRIGAEAEVILPFNRNKWAVLLEPEFRTYSSSPGPGFAIDYKAVQILLCGRYFLFISPESKLYVTAGLLTNFNLGSTIEYETQDLVLQPRLGGTAAVGFRYKDRFGVELQYQFPEDILENYTLLRGDLSTASLVFSYKIL